MPFLQFWPGGREACCYALLLMHPAAGLHTCLLGTRVDGTSDLPQQDLLMLGTAPDYPVSSAAAGAQAHAHQAVWSTTA